MHDEYEYLYHGQGFALHHGGDKLHEEAVSAPSKQGAQLELVAHALFTLQISRSIGR